MKSFSILKTNPSLTTNVKILINSNYKLSLDSFENIDGLQLNRFKNFRFTPDDIWDDLIPKYYKNIPKEIAFKQNDEILNKMGSDFNEQFDEIYQYGVKNITSNKNHDEDFEYFAPLYVDKNKFPSHFFIFRVDGIGFEKLTKNNFKKNIIQNFKTVKVFDLSEKTNLGKWIKKSFTENEYFPNAPLEMDYRNLEFSEFNGVDYDLGGYTSKPVMMDSILESETEIYELEKYITKSYENQNIIFPHILNFSFLFNDVPSDSKKDKKWTINRYYGFYINDLDYMESISFYDPYELRDDFEIQEGNYLYSSSNPDNPFKTKWSNEKPFYIEYEGNFYLVKLINRKKDPEIGFENEGEFIDEQYLYDIEKKYKIISDIDLTSKESYINDNIGYIDSDNFLRKKDGSYYTIANFDQADVWVIHVIDSYYNLINIDGKIKINIDYKFTFHENYFTYEKAGVETRISLVVDFDKKPKSFKIYRLNFTDIKNFDQKIIDTEFSKFQYEKKYELTDTEEPKLYMENFKSNTYPRELDSFIYNSEHVNIPVSSEYTTNFETFRLDNNELSSIWRINSDYVRWGYQNSLNTIDYSYPLNNSKLFETFNKDADVFEEIPKRNKRNLDYFYTINSNSNSYLFHSLHIEDHDSDNSLNVDYNFNFSDYLDTGYDYFSYFFENKTNFDSGEIKQNVKKYSLFNKNDGIIPNTTLFKGIEFRLFDVESLELSDDNQKIDTLNLNSTDEFNDYKFSILTTQGDSNMEWDIIENWKMDKEYKQDSLVLYEGFLYKADVDTICTEPTTIKSFEISGSSVDINVKTHPGLLDDWSSYDTSNINIFLPQTSYSTGDIIYNYGEFYHCVNTAGSVDFWKPGEEYAFGDYVLYRNLYYECIIADGNYAHPTNDNYWKKISSPGGTLIWNKINIWNPSAEYNNNDYVIYNDKVYRSNSDNIEIGEIPDNSSSWVLKYDINPDAYKIYKQSDNPIIKMNNKYYLIKSNPSDETLENGIKIYINKMFKNVLINIYVNDNTYTNLKNTNRDELYDELYQKLTANNFINTINILSEKNGFSDFIEYIIIDEEGNNYNYKFDDNINQLPHILLPSTPDSFDIKINSLKTNALRNPNSLKPDLRLKNNNNILNLNMLNWYNNIPYSYEISKDKNERKISNIFSSIKNIKKLTLRRFSGYYNPIFYNIPLFDKTTTETGNYKFDTELTDFGLFKERKFKKINPSGSILKLRNVRNIRLKSVYPMIGEFGYSYEDFFIFKSSWDPEFHYETVKNDLDSIEDATIEINKPDDIGSTEFSI